MEYKDALENLAKKWLYVQLTNDVSAAATNSFWKLALSSFPQLLAAKEESNVNKNVPGYIHLRRQLYNDCPPVHMKYAYQNKGTGEIVVVSSVNCPARNFPKTQFIKLYEEAHIKVILNISSKSRCIMTLSN